MADHESKLRRAVVEKYSGYRNSWSTGPICCKGENTEPCHACGRFICKMSGCCETYDHKECRQNCVSLCRKCGPRFVAELEDADKREQTEDHEHVQGILTPYEVGCPTQYIWCCYPRCGMFGKVITEREYELWTRGKSPSPDFDEEWFEKRWCNYPLAAEPEAAAKPVDADTKST